jgi:hypothetical protein
MDNETEDVQPARTERPPATDWAADVEIDFIPSTPSFFSQSQTSVDAAGGEGVTETPVAASQAAASLDAAPATGAAASTVDPTPSPLPPTPSPLPPTPSPPLSSCSFQLPQPQLLLCHWARASSPPH